MRQRDVPPPHEALERRSVNTEGLGRVADIPAVLREGLLEKLLFQPLEGHLLPVAERVPVLTSSASHNDLGKLLRCDTRSLDVRDGPFDDVLQLPHIAGPLVPGQQLQGFPGHAVDLSAVARPIALQKMSGEEGNIFASLPQRGDIDLDDSEPEEQILAESLCPQFLRN